MEAEVSHHLLRTGVRLRAGVGRWVRVLCAPKFGALMRDTLRPDALPASPVAPRHGCGWPFVLVRLVRLAALHSQPVRLCWVSCGLLLAAAGSLGCVRPCAVSVFFSLASLAALLCCSVPLQALRMLRPAALIVSHLVRLCWFAAGSLLVVSMLRSLAGFCCSVKPCGSVSFLLLVPAAALHSVEFPAIDRPGLAPCSAPAGL